MHRKHESDRGSTHKANTLYLGSSPNHNLFALWPAKATCGCCIEHIKNPSQPYKHTCSYVEHIIYFQTTTLKKKSWLVADFFSSFKLTKHSNYTQYWKKRIASPTDQIGSSSGSPKRTHKYTHKSPYRRNREKRIDADARYTTFLLGTACLSGG